MLNELAYVVVREDLDGPIIQSQVIEILTNLVKEESEKITLVWFFRLDYIFRGGRRIRDIRNDLHKKGIDMVAIPFVSLGFPVSWYLIPFVLPQWWLGILWVYIVKEKHIFHCRSYHSALAGVFFKYIFPIKVIFDPRSPFPEENLAANRWNKKGYNYVFWKKIEKFLCRKSDAIIAISNPFRDSLGSVAPDSRIEVIPNNYPVSFILNNNNEKELREELQIIRICYAGTFGHWNNPEPYLRFLEFIVKDRRFLIEAKFIIPSQFVTFLEASLEKITVDRAKFSVLSVSQGDVIKSMSDCVVGLQIMSRPDDRLSIKFVEYLAAGLPVIVSENVRGAADIVKRYEVGFVINDDFSNKHEALQFIHNVAKNRTFWRDKCRNLAEKQFSCNVVSKKLKSLYEAV